MGLKIQHRDEMHLNMHIWLANCSFQDVQFGKWYRLRQVVFRAEVESAVESSLELALGSTVCVG